MGRNLLYTEQDIISLCSTFGIKYVKGWKNTNQPFIVTCSCGREKQQRLYNLSYSNTCSSCRIHHRKYSQEAIAEELNSYNLMIACEYQNNRTPITYICECGGIGQTKLCHIRNGTRCTHCTEMHIRSKFAELGYEVIKYDKSISVTCRCTCGSLFTTNASNFFKNYSGCHNCKVHWNYNPNKDRTVRPALSIWKRLVLTRDRHICQACNSTISLNVHHIIAFSADKSLAADINNGITLCSNCHKELHSLFGYNVGQNNLSLYINALKLRRFNTMESAF